MMGAISHVRTVQEIREALIGILGQLDAWFEVPAAVRDCRPQNGGWSIAQVLAHVALTNHYLLIVIRRGTEKAVRRAAAGGRIVPGESDLARLRVIGERGSFTWVRPDHMEPVEMPPPEQLREKLGTQRQECLDLLKRMPNGEGSLHRVTMSVQALGKLDMYEWLYFLAQHARRHLAQMETIRAEHEHNICT